MSIEACNYVKKYSRYKNSTFWVHYILADLVDAENNYEIYVLRKNLVEEWPVCLRTIDHAIAALVEDGYLTVLETHGPKRPVRYQFNFKGVEDTVTGVTRKNPGSAKRAYISNVRTNEADNEMAM